MKSDLEARSLTLKTEASQVAEKLNGKSFTVLRQASESGQLFGSVSPRDLVGLISEAGFNVNRNQIALNTPIKTIGQHKVPLALHPEIETSITIIVARNSDEAARIARGEDVTQLREADRAGSRGRRGGSVLRAGRRRSRSAGRRRGGGRSGRRRRQEADRHRTRFVSREYCRAAPVRCRSAAAPPARRHSSVGLALARGWLGWLAWRLGSRLAELPQLAAGAVTTGAALAARLPAPAYGPRLAVDRARASCGAAVGRGAAGAARPRLASSSGFASSVGRCSLAADGFSASCAGRRLAGFGSPALASPRLGALRSPAFARAPAPRVRAAARAENVGRQRGRLIAARRVMLAQEARQHRGCSCRSPARAWSCGRPRNRWRKSRPASCPGRYWSGRAPRAGAPKPPSSDKADCGAKRRNTLTSSSLVGLAIILTQNRPNASGAWQAPAERHSRHCWSRRILF